MNKSIFFLCLVIFVGTLFSCNLARENNARDLYKAVWGKQIDWVKEILSKGADPDYCIGECGWLDANPLNVLSEKIDNTYTYYGDPESVIEPVPSVVILKLLIDAGADVNKRPYVWDMVHFYDNDIVHKVERYRKQSNRSLEREDINDQVKYFVSDVNRLLQAFLEAGANPDHLGHPYPYSAEAMYAEIDNKRANEYFLTGTRAVNIAIEKGILWESQVDLLLQYTKLDEESLKAAQRSNDSAMIEKIKRLWEMQKKS